METTKPRQNPNKQVGVSQRERSMEEQAGREQGQGTLAGAECHSPVHMLDGVGQAARVSLKFYVS